MRLPSLKVDADQIAREAGSPRHCPHVKQELRKKIDKSGQPRLWKQCLVCGSPVGTRVSAKPYNWQDRKSTRLNSSHVAISYDVFCLKKKSIITDSSRTSRSVG